MRITSQNSEKSYPIHFLRLLLISQILSFCLCTTIAFVYFEKLRLASFVLGQFFLSIEILLMFGQLKALKTKKSVAWAIGIIVIKYPLFVGILVFLAKICELPMFYFFAGMATIVVIALIYLVLIKFISIRSANK